MTALQRQIVCSLRDLRYVSVECKHCHSFLTVDMTTQTDFQTQNNVFIPAACPVCRQGYDSALKNLFTMRSVYEALLPVGDRITFRSQPESDDLVREANAKD